jgi:hypothetical protein
MAMDADLEGTAKAVIEYCMQTTGAPPPGNTKEVEIWRQKIADVRRAKDNIQFNAGVTVRDLPLNHAATVSISWHSLTDFLCAGCASRDQEDRRTKWDRFVYEGHATSPPMWLLGFHGANHASFLGTTTQ